MAKLTDERLLSMAAKALGYASIDPERGAEEGPGSFRQALEVFPEELIAFARVALAAEPPAPAKHVATLHVSDFRGYENYDFQHLVDLPPGRYELFTTCTVQPPAPAVPDEVRAAFAELERRQENLHYFRDLRKELAAEPPAPDPREALAARPLLEAVARLGDRIGQHTVAEITTISDRAAAWLRENPPGQPVAIEPRGCPTPGACSCVEAPAPADPSDFQTLQGIALDMVESLRPIVLPEILGVLRRAIKQAPAPAPAADGEREELIQWLDCFHEYAYELGRPDWGHMTTRAAALLRQPAPAPVPVAERPWERPGWCDAEGECWWRGRRDPAWWTAADPRMVHDGWLLPHWAIPSPQPPQGGEVLLPHWAIPRPPQGGEVA
jgi:hypothetical protein